MTGGSAQPLWARILRRLRRKALRLEENSEPDLFRALKELGATVEEQDWGVGGAVETTTALITLGAARATLTLRSYEGPTLSGDPELIDRIAATIPVLEKMPCDIRTHFMRDDITRAAPTCRAPAR